MSSNLPQISHDGGLARYLREVRAMPMLEPEDEYVLAKAFVDHDDRDAAHKLVTSHLRLVAKIAMGYRGYGLPINEIISEGNIGLMQAVKRFDPEKGFRLATYAMWWIRAAIQEYILRSWSLVKIGTTASQKKLFFNLRRMKNRIQQADEGNLKPEEIKSIADHLKVAEADVSMMEQRMGGTDRSLNAPMRDEESGGEWQDWLVDERLDQESYVAEEQERAHRKNLLEQAISELNEREQIIVRARRLSEEPDTLETLAQQFGISRERVRQIEGRAMEKLEKSIRRLASQQLLSIQ